MYIHIYIILLIMSIMIYNRDFIFFCFFFLSFSFFIIFHILHIFHLYYPAFKKSISSLFIISTVTYIRNPPPPPFKIHPPPSLLHPPGGPNRILKTAKAFDRAHIRHGVSYKKFHFLPKKRFLNFFFTLTWCTPKINRHMVGGYIIGHY